MNIKKVIFNPIHYMNLIIAILRGTFYILYFRIFKQNVKIGFPLIAYGKVKIIGPGKVIIGKKVTVAENVFRGLTIVTLSKQSTVEIGNRGLLAGLTIRCIDEIKLGNDVMTAVSLIQDSVIINLDDSILESSYNNHTLSAKKILIKDNVWLGGHVCIISGCTIKNNCVISSGSVCVDTTVDDYYLCSGNPLKRPLPITQLLALKQKQ